MNYRKTAFYLRLSLSDGDMGEDNKDESNSIENQRLLITTYLEDHPDIPQDVEEYIDDGYSGTTFKRPEFIRMIEDAKLGKVGTVIVKDLSRLGRDYIECGDYIEQIFPVLGVRFIAINNFFDSDSYGGDTLGFDMAITNLINHLYSRDISKKVRTAMEVKWKQGYTTNGRAPYGYLPNPKEKGRWIVDPETAPVVKFIFELANKGYKVDRIITELNDRKIPTPGLMCKVNDFWRSDKYIVPKDERLWEYIMVHRILKNYVYTGAFVAGKRRTVTLGSKSYKKLPKNQWTIVEDVNEPIVSKEDFENAQAIFKTMKKSYSTAEEYPLKGKLRCGNCKTSLMKGYRGSGDILFCNHSRSKGKASKCCKDDYQMSQLVSLAGTAIRNMIYKVQFLREQVEEQLEKDKEELLDVAEIRKLKSKIEQLQAEKIREYENYADGNYTREMYLAKKERLTAQIDSLSEQIIEQENINKLQNDVIREITNIAKAGDDYFEHGLSKEVVDAFIKTIYVYSSEKVEIVFKCEDEIRNALNLLKAGA